MILFVIITTGNPKGAKISQENLKWTVEVEMMILFVFALQDNNHGSCITSKRNNLTWTWLKEMMISADDDDLVCNHLRQYCMVSHRKKMLFERLHASSTVGKWTKRSL